MPGKRQSDPVPGEAECLAMLDETGVGADLRVHILKVTDVAVRLARALQARGVSLDLDLVRAGALLHDVAKGKPDHEAEGARRVRDRGWIRTAVIVAQHADLPWDEGSMLDEAAVVYYADRLVGGPELLGVEERFRRQRAKYGNDAVKIRRVDAKEKHARFIESIFARALGADPMDIVKESYSKEISTS